MELYIKFYKAEELKLLQETIFFEDDPYIDPLRITSSRDEYFHYSNPETQDELDAEVDAVMDVIGQVKRIAPSSRIAYVSAQDEGNGWMMCACSFEDEDDIHEKEYFNPDSAFASQEWFDTMRKKIRVKPRVSYSGEEFQINEDGVLLKYSGNGGEVVIPENVRTIGNCAFENRKDVYSVVIPEGVEQIGAAAFGKCVNLTSVSLPKSLQAIGNGAFSHCYSLTEITIPENINSINSMGLYTFDSCKKLRSITMKHNSESTCFKRRISWYSIRNCPSLFDENGFLIVDSWLFKYSGSSTDVVVPDGIVGIDGAFRDNKVIQSVVLPDTLRKIDGAAFEGCSNLTKICIPKNVSEIGFQAFRNCENLEVVDIGNTDVQFGHLVFDGCPKLVNAEGYVVVNGKAVSYQGTAEHLAPPAHAIDVAFMLNKTIRSVVIPEGVTEIKPSAFKHCTKLESVQLPQSLKHIGAQAFEYCSSLKEIVIPQSVETIGFSAFGNCYNLVSVQMSQETVLCQSFYKSAGLIDKGRIIVAGYLDYYEENKRKKIVIPKTVRIIEDNALNECKGLEELHIPASVERIGRLPEGITIYGKAGSYAEEYAKENNLPFVAK